MTSLERTRQQLDPVGTTSAWVLSVFFAGSALTYGITMTLVSSAEITSPLLAVLALVWLAAAAAAVSMATFPIRAPFPRATHVAVQLLALGAVVLSAASRWGNNSFIQDDFGSISLGLLILAMGVYRPALELASMGVLSALGIGFITLLQVPSFAANAPAGSFVLVGMTAVLAMSFGSAAFSHRLVLELERWQHRSAKSVARVSTRLAEGITRSVQQDRVKILDRDVFPFFNGLLSKEVVSQEDRLRAREISDSIRALMVAEADRTWLEVVAGDDGVGADDMHRSVVDPAGRATKMVPSQRTVLRALIVAVRADDTFVAQSLKVTISGSVEVNRGLLVASFHPDAHDPHDPRDSFAPYFAVMRIVFTEVSVDLDFSKLTVSFAYEQQRREDG